MSQKVKHNKKLARSDRNKQSGKYARQRARTAANKARRTRQGKGSISGRQA